MKTNKIATYIWTFFFWGFIFPFVLVAQDLPEGQEQEIEVIVGVDRIIRVDFDPHTRVQIGNQQILDFSIAPQRREIILKGQSAGSTSVTVREQNTGDIRARYLVNVVATDQSRVVQDLREHLGDIEGIEIGIRGGEVYVGGHIIVPNDIGRVVVVLEKFPDVMTLVELSPQTQRVIAARMEEEIQSSGLRDVSVRVVNNLFWLEGVVRSNDQYQLAERIANAYIPDQIESLARRRDAVRAARGRSLIQNFIAIDPESQPEPAPPMIKVSAQFVELTRDYNRTFGFSWTPLLTGSGGEINVGRTAGGEVTTRSRGTLTATISNLFPKLASAKSAGHARIVQSGVVVIKDGVQGSIRKSTTTPFALGSGEFTRADSATAGFELQVTPSVIEDEKVNLSMGISVSATSGNPPETTQNAIQTEMVVDSGESAVVGGIVINQSSTGFDRDPPFGQLDFENPDLGTPLFSFIRSRAHTSGKSQFVVFVTPEIIQSASEGTEEIRRKFRRRGR